MKVIAVNVGVGDAIHIQTPSGKNYLIDGGDTSAITNFPALDDADQDFCPIVKYLLDNNIRTIDMMVITHDDGDHYKGLQAILGTKVTSGGANAFKVYSVVYASTTSDLTKLSEHPETTLVRVLSGIRFENVAALSGIWDTALTGLVLSPRTYTGSSSSNSGAVVMRIKYDQVSCLFTADAETADETTMMADYAASELSSTVLKVAHHGSRTGSSETFLNVVKPKVALISVAGNAYGLPDAEVVKRISDTGATILRTDQRGNVGIVTNGINYTISASANPVGIKGVSADPNVHVYPNPAPGKTNPASTKIVYDLTGLADSVKVSVLTPTGDLVREWIDGTTMQGSNYLTWDLKNGMGENVANGLYIVQVEVKVGAGTVYGHTKMAVLRK